MLLRQTFFVFLSQPPVERDWPALRPYVTKPCRLRRLYFGLCAPRASEFCASLGGQDQAQTSEIKPELVPHLPKPLLPLVCASVLLSLALAAQAEETAAEGPVAALGRALALYQKAEAANPPQPLTLAQAAALASSVQLRPATARAPDIAPFAPSAGQAADPKPAEALPLGAALAFLQSGEAMGAAFMQAGDDDALLDQIEPLAAEAAWPHRSAASITEASLAPDQRHDWRLPFEGQSPAELTLLPLGAGGAEWQLTSDSGEIICALRPIATQSQCAFTPEVNSYYRLSVTPALTPEAAPLRYMLITN